MTVVVLRLVCRLWLILWLVGPDKVVISMNSQVSPQVPTREALQRDHEERIVWDLLRIF